MKVIEFIKEHGLAKLEEKYGIVITDYTDRVVLNYHQINSPRIDPITIECRALILRKGTWEVLCRSFDRFYNYDSNSSFNFSEAVCYEKMDGSLVNIYHDGQSWIAATRKMAYAEGESKFGNTFSTLILKALRGTHFEGRSEEYVYICELTSPENRIVTKYSDYNMTLLAVRNKVTGVELDRKQCDMIAESLDLNRPKIYEFLNINMVMKNIRELPKLDEGYVCHNEKTGERIKVKNPSYLAIAHLRNDGDISAKRVKQLIFEKGHVPYLLDFPEDFSVFSPYIEGYTKMMEDLAELWSKSTECKTQKEFAMLVKDSGVSPLMFHMKRGNNFNDAMNAMKPNAKIAMLDKYL